MSHRNGPLEMVRWLLWVFGLNPRYGEVHLIDGIDVFVGDPDNQATLEPNALKGKLFRRGGRMYVVVDNSLLGLTARPLHPFASAMQRAAED